MIPGADTEYLHGPNGHQAGCYIYSPVARTQKSTSWTSWPASSSPPKSLGQVKAGSIMQPTQTEWPTCM
ncbi:hypothetical protein PF008_g31810 [Phytophthora fragariae]|uniref:Uncharacterized protein n=1 Tax=Phytophthora fragariae TaxID=53985 RepID=A0A6G0Q1L6_9STRA|nr:hypothetical protein PF008_g31810 [Phytophthora fragariae]